ncbi:MAG: TetR/AcrR family transcriptional regulator [Spongiibacteraceae bacterium]|jgi:AcrR family transcriptional regulator|nr:TetR/AcrR family transcriptional regulator [Spongiibacteraceae bacterium]
MSSTTTRRKDTRARFLSAAEQEFLASGYEGATIRRITARAGTSPATLHRLWGTKRELFMEVFRKRIEPIEIPQLRLFAHLQAALDAGEAVSPRAVIRALMDPFFQLGRSADPDARRGIQVFSRAVIEPAPEAQAIVLELIGPARTALYSLLQATIPGLRGEDFFLGLSCVFGCFLYPMGFGQRLAHDIDIDFDEIDWDRAADRITEFLQSGLLTLCRDPAGPKGLAEG